VLGLLEDPARLRAMGHRAREAAREKFPPERHLGALLAYYDKVCGEAVR